MGSLNEDTLAKATERLNRISVSFLKVLDAHPDLHRHAKTIRDLLPTFTTKSAVKASEIAVMEVITAAETVQKKVSADLRAAYKNGSDSEALAKIQSYNKFTENGSIRAAHFLNTLMEVMDVAP